MLPRYTIIRIFIRRNTATGILINVMKIRRYCPRSKQKKGTGIIYLSKDIVQILQNLGVSVGKVTYLKV